MRLWRCPSTASWLAAALWAVSGARAAEFKRFDGVHRIEKAEVTQRAMLLARDEDSDACGTSMKLCASSLNGGCCPDNYDCAKESCYATTRGPSTCGTKIGWYACAQKYGGETHSAFYSWPELTVCRWLLSWRLHVPDGRPMFSTVWVTIYPRLPRQPLPLPGILELRVLPRWDGLRREPVLFH